MKAVVAVAVCVAAAVGFWVGVVAAVHVLLAPAEAARVVVGFAAFAAAAALVVGESRRVMRARQTPRR